MLMMCCFFLVKSVGSAKDLLCRQDGSVGPILNGEIWAGRGGTHPPPPLSLTANRLRCHSRNLEKVAFFFSFFGLFVFVYDTATGTQRSRFERPPFRSEAPRRCADGRDPRMDRRPGPSINRALHHFTNGK